jgi:hypothetical protein
MLNTAVAYRLWFLQVYFFPLRKRSKLEMLGNDSWNCGETEAYGNSLFTILPRAAFVYDWNGENVFLWKEHIDRSPPSDTEMKLCSSASLQCTMVENFIILT